ncbi:hypothetical protein PRJ_5503 (plasmid) [Pseudomonas sp. XWY-1]|nr:hypothetical protein PRJ_5503 [Pseudomonas sp. XWY-1]
MIIPLQCGELSAGEMLANAKRIFQTDQFCAGIPSNLAAMSAEDCATLHHHDFHLLGRVVINEELGDKLRAMLANNPDAIYTADANWLRSRIKEISLAAKEMRQAPADNPFETSRTRAVRAILRQDPYHQQPGPSGARQSELTYGT